MDNLKEYLEHNKYTHKLKKHLSHKRYEHTIRVAETACHLAKKHNHNTNEAVVAALLHDCAKNFPEHKLKHYCKKHHLKLSHAEEDNIDLLHSRVGAIVAKEDYHVIDSDILNAIRYHTTGRPSMSTLEKIIYISDYIEPGRKHRDRLEEVRHMATIDLDTTMYMILEDTLLHLKQKSKTKDPRTKETFIYYKGLRKELI